nr:hypothetical protein [Tanacetum cinerariifolium]
MPIPGNLITVDIQGKSYYKEYLEKVAKHQIYLAGEKGSDHDSPAPNPAKATKKSKPSAPKVDLRLPVTKSASSQQPEPKPAPAKSQGKKCIPEKEPRFDDEEADVQRALEESLKSVYDAPRGPLPPMVIREPESGKYQPLPEAMDVSTQLHPEQIDKGFIATAYPKVQENLKQTVEEHVILKEPASSTGTLSSLQHLTKDLSFGDLFFNDKTSKADNEKTTVKTEAESMVSVTIQQDTSSTPPMTTSIIDLTSRPDSLNVHRPLQAMATETTTTITTTTHPPPPQLQQSITDSMLMKRIDIPQQVSKAVDEIVTDAVDWAIQASLRNHFRDLPEADMIEIIHQRMWETNSYKAHEDHMMLYEALEKSMNCDQTDELLKDMVKACKKKKKRHDSPKTPPGSPPH